MDSSFVIGNGIVTDGEGLFVPSGAIRVEDGLIAEIGPAVDLKDQSLPFYDVGGRMILPGLTNFHHHLYSHFAPGITPHGPSVGFVEVLEDLWWPLDAVMDEDSIYWSALSGAMDCVRSGVTTVFDHHASMNCVSGSLNIIKEALSLAGIKGVLAFEVSNRLGEDRVAEQIEENISFWSDNRRSPSFRGLMGLHANFTLSERTMALLEEALPEEMAIHIHCGEGLYDLQYCQNEGYQGPVDRLKSFNLLKRNSLLAHCIHLSDYDYDLLKELQIEVVTNPESNFNNRVGTMDRSRIGSYLLGTDGMTSDMIASLRSAYLMDREAPELWEGLARAFFEGKRDYENSFFPSMKGLERGSSADIAVLDYVPLAPVDISNVLGHVIFGAKGGAAYMTISSGKILWKDGHFTTLHVSSLQKEAKKAAYSLHRRFYDNNWNKLTNTL